MTEISYTQLTCNYELLTTTRNHITGHVYLIFRDDQGNYQVILGHNEKHDNVASFGGFSEEGENLLQTICREYSEETLDCILSLDDLISALATKSVVITRKSPKGHHFTVFCNVTGLSFNLKTIQSNFKEKLNQPDIKSCQQENDNIVVVNLKDIENAIRENNYVVKDFDFHNQKIRDINVPAYKWFVNALKANMVSGLFST